MRCGGRQASKPANIEFQPATFPQEGPGFCQVTVLTNSTLSGEATNCFPGLGREISTFSHRRTAICCADTPEIAYRPWREDRKCLPPDPPREAGHHSGASLRIAALLPALRSYLAF